MFYRNRHINAVSNSQKKISNFLKIIDDLYLQPYINQKRTLTSTQCRRNKYTVLFKNEVNHEWKCQVNNAKVFDIDVRSTVKTHISNFFT